MMLIKGEIFKKSQNLIQHILKNDHILKNNETFRNSSCSALNLQNYIHVHQREYATVISKPPISYVGSSDATTCSILFLRSPETTKTTCAHLDNVVSPFSFNKLIQTFDKNERNYLDIYIVGGVMPFLSSERILLSFIDRMIALSDCITFNIKLAYVLNENDPFVRDAVMDIKTGEVLRLLNSPKILENLRGPDFILRNIRLFSGDLIGLQCFYDYSLNSWKVPPFSYEPPEDLDNLLAMSDEELLQVMSTSPKHESELFCKDARAMLQFMKDHSKLSFY